MEQSPIFVFGNLHLMGASLSHTNKLNQQHIMNKRSVRLLLRACFIWLATVGAHAFALAQAGGCLCPAPTKLQVLEVNTTSYTISWLAPPPPASVTGYIVKTSIAATGLVVSEEWTAGPPYTRTGLAPNTEYKVEVFSVCRCGRSTQAASVIIRTLGIIIEDVIIQYNGPRIIGSPVETSLSQIDWEGGSSPEYIKAKIGTDHFWIKRTSATQFELLNPLNLSLQVDNTPVSAASVRIGSVEIKVSSDSVAVVGGIAQLERY